LDLFEVAGVQNVYHTVMEPQHSRLQLTHDYVLIVSRIADNRTAGSLFSGLIRGTVSTHFHDYRILEVPSTHHRARRLCYPITLTGDPLAKEANPQ
jgi:hypothetical protein